MLVMPLKPLTRFDVMAPLAAWLDGAPPPGKTSTLFQPTNPLQLVVPKPDFKSVHCRKDLLRLASLRNCLADAIPRANSHQHALEERALADCHEYHAALLEFEKRGFPTLDGDDSNGLHLTWKGAFALQQTEVHSSLIWDRSCTLWNLAALESFLAAEENIATRDGCKAAIQHCQSGASVLAVLKELVESQDFATVDLSVPMLQFWERLLLGQAQYCIYKLATLGDSPKHQILSLLSMGVVSLYNEALTNTQNPRLQSEVPRQAEEWGAHCKAHSMLASAKAEFHQAVAHRLKAEWGMEIARLTKCLTYLESARDFVNQTSGDSSGGKDKSSNNNTKANLEEVQRQVDTLLRIVGDRAQQAKKDNTAVYQDLVPSHRLEDVTPQILAKANLPMPSTMIVPKVALFLTVPPPQLPPPPPLDLPLPPNFPPPPAYGT